MNKTRNDLPEATRKAMCDLMGARLADAIDLSLQAKQAHWNVKGPQFFALHQLFDKIYEAAGEQVDDVAERIVELGGTADGTLPTTSKKTTLPAFPNGAVAAEVHLAALAGALATFGKGARAAIDAAAKAGDADTADLFTEISRENDKYLWMVEAHLQ
jgi:starvation-inducible DNA-binding protein